MDYIQHDYKTLGHGEPLDDSFRIRLEAHLRETVPNGVEVELLCRERRIAEALERGESVDELVQDYKQFRLAQHLYIWDMRGRLTQVFRPFSLWLVQVDPSRLLAVQFAIQSKLSRTLQLHTLPVEIARGMHPDAAWDTRHGIIDFVRRYTSRDVDRS